MDFKGSKKITLKSNDSAVVYTFRHTVSTATARGWLPVGSTITSVSVASYKLSSGAWSSVSDLVVSSEISGADIRVSLKYPSTNGAGRYKIVLSAGADTFGTKDAEFNQIFAK